MKHLLAAVVLLIGMAACGLPGSQVSGTASHKCADLVAQATTTTSPVLGLWACLTPAFQTKLKAAGAVTNGAFDGALSVGVALRAPFLGADADYATYELFLNPGMAQQVGVKTVELTVWLDPSGKVDNLGIPQAAF